MGKSNIHIKPENKGKLHRKLGVPEDQKLTMEQISIKPDDSESLRKMKQFAINARKWKKEHGGILLKYQGGDKLNNFFGSGNNFGYSNKGFTGQIFNYGQGPTLGLGYQKSGNLKGLLYRGNIGVDKNLRTGELSTSYGGGLNYGLNIGKRGRLDFGADYNKFGQDKSMGANISGNIGNLIGRASVNKFNDNLSWSAGLEHRGNIGKLETTKGLDFSSGERNPNITARMGASYPITDKIRANVNWNKNLTDKDSKANFGAGVTMNFDTGGKLKRQFLKDYPVYKDLYKRNLKIKKDKDFTQGFGSIEFFSPDTKQVDYRTEEEWEADINQDKIVKSPGKGKKYGVLYNPDKSGKGDVFLDLYSHGMQTNIEDEELKKLYQNFKDATTKHQQKSIEKWYKVDEAEGLTQDGPEAWLENWVAGELRAWKAAELKPEDDNYAEGRKFQSEEMKKAAKEIDDYLRGKK